MIRPYKTAFLLLLSTLIFLFESSTNAKIVTQNVARDAANRFINEQHLNSDKLKIATQPVKGLNESFANHTLGDIKPIKDHNGIVLAYVQELKPEGFIITSADDTVRPVLGFSAKGTFPYSSAKNNPLLNLLKIDIQSKKKAINSGGLANKYIALLNILKGSLKGSSLRLTFD